MGGPRTHLPQRLQPLWTQGHSPWAQSRLVLLLTLPQGPRLRKPGEGSQQLCPVQVEGPEEGRLLGTPGQACAGLMSPVRRTLSSYT